MQNPNHYIAIMAGGVGSRFWPASRENRPKQFLDILGIGRTLIQLTFDRASLIVPKENILIVSNRMYRDLILDQLPEISDSQLLLEPSRNNTAPCVAYTALHLQARNAQAVFAMLPADHVILKEKEFVKNMNQAFSFASQEDAIVTLGITPTRPDTGYGYINYKNSDQPVKSVNAFKEKPDHITAQKYLNSGDYLWNAGIFIWSVETILNAFKNNANEIINVLCQDESHFNTTSERDYIDRVYPLTKKISVDFAILEQAQNVYTIPSDIAWSDLGTWNSLYDYLEKDNNSNVSKGGQAMLTDCQGNFVRTSNDEKIIVAKGIKDFIIIDDDNVLLIYPRHEEQEIKKLRNTLSDTSFV